jgi:adenine-specific DNA-methyltransferase
MPKKKTPALTVSSLKHSDKRANIPTEELRDFVAEDEKQPKTLLYPRDPSLDPQLVWKGKDEQDRQPLEVPAVPVYIQEKISPQAIIENVRTSAVGAMHASPLGDHAIAEPQLQLFSDFNNIPFDVLVDFYQHEQSWTNRMILGDSLLVMASLAEKENLKGRVQMIYLDPPYGIKFGSNWQSSTRKRDVRDGKADDLTLQPEQIKAFRDTWQLGIHSYLSYLRDRLTLVRELLTDSGSIFVQISEENVHLIRNLLDEIFGSENFISQIIFKTTASKASAALDCINDYLLWYSKDKDQIKYRPVFGERDTSSTEQRYAYFDDDTEDKKINLSSDDEIDINNKFRITALNSQGESKGDSSKSFTWRGNKYLPPVGRHWSVVPDQIKILEKANRLIIEGKNLCYKRFLMDYP